MATENNAAATSADESSAPEAKAGRPKPTKNLPTDRVSFEKQKLILRAVVKASLAVDRGGVSNNDVARYAGVTPSSVSNCNGFWVDAGLLIRDGIKLRPVDALFDYDQAAEWMPETAFTKVAGVLAGSWFGKAMLTKLAIKPTSLSDALAFLAQECSAHIDYKPQLTVVLDYLADAGLIIIDGSTVTKAPMNADTPPPTPTPAPTVAPLNGAGTSNTGHAERERMRQGMRRITIALPTHDDVTIEFPEALDADDWILVANQLATYIKRWKRLQSTAALKEETKDE